MDATFTHNAHFGFCGVIGTADDRTGVAHAPAGRSRLAGDETYNRLCAIGFDPVGCFGFHTTADLTDHYDALGFRIVHEQFNGFFGGGTDDGVTANTDGGSDAHTGFHDLVSRFVGQGTGFRNDADIAFFEDKSGHDTHFAFTCGDDTGTVRADEAGVLALQVVFHFHHVLDGNAFGDTNHQGNSCVCGFHHCIGSESRGNEDDADVCAGLLNGISYGIKNGLFQVEGTAFTGGYTTNQVGTIFNHLGGVEGAFRAGKSLNNNL